MRAVTASLAGGFAGALSVSSLWSKILETLQSSPIPLGVFPVALAIAYLLSLAYDYLEGRARTATTIQPMKPIELRSVGSADVAPSRLRGTFPPRPGTPRGPEDAPLSTPDTPSVTGPGPAVTSAPLFRVWRPSGTEEAAEPWVPRTTSTPPPRPTPFARNLLLGFGVIVLLVMLVRHPFFFAYDLVVRSAGQLIYWPLPWPGVIPTPSPTSVAPDYIFLMYISLILSFLLASGVPFSEHYSESQRRLVLGLVASYLPTEVLIDVAYFTIGEPFTASAFFVLRGLVGGVYFSAVLISTLVLPPPIYLPRRLKRDLWSIVSFFGSALVSLLVAGAILYYFFHDLGLGRHLIPFAVLLLLPLLALTVWGVVGRVLYELEVRRRPPVPLSAYHPTVSVIVPAYNEAVGIADAIRSVEAAAALYPGDVELLIANDGSTDRTSEIARREVGLLRHARGAVIDLPHGGKSNALNGALRVAQGEIIIRLDADARLSPETGFGAIVGHFAQPQVGGVQGLILPLQEEGWTRSLRLMEISWTHLFLRRATMATRATQVVDGAFCAFRREDLLAVGGWVAWNGEDTEVTLRLQRVGYRMRFETGAAAFEDVPENFRKLERQRIRWSRGGLFAHQRHFPALLSDRLEYGGLAMVFWLFLFIRSGMRSLIYIYAALVVLYLPTILHVAVIAALLMIPRIIVMATFMVHYGRARFIPWVVIWPGTAALKAHFSIESFGTMLPGAMPEFAE